MMKEAVLLEGAAGSDLPIYLQFHSVLCACVQAQVTPYITQHEPLRRESALPNPALAVYQDGWPTHHGE